MKASELHWRGPDGFRCCLLFLALFLLLANGRMDSGDANAELQGSLNLAQHGSLGTDRPYDDTLIQSLFVRSPSGRYYEAHDIGNSLLMLPAAWIGLSAAALANGFNIHGAAGTYNESHLIVAKTLASVTETIFSAIACYFLFRLFHLYLGRRISILLALLFPFGTYFAGYFRSAWDVVPACNACCILLYYLTAMFQEHDLRSTTPMSAAFWLGTTCLFRYSLLPFLGLSAALVFWKNRSHFAASDYLWSGCIFIATLLPTLLFNLVRMDSLFMPATMSVQFSGQNGFSFDVLPAVRGLLVSPNRGLLVFSPLLLLLTGLPWLWRMFPAEIRRLLTCLAPGVLCYILLIANLRNWGAAGWGPRYLLPVLPVLFIAAGFIISILWDRNRSWRLTAVSVILVSGVVAIPAIVVNHTDAIRLDARAIEVGESRPRQILDTIQSLILALKGSSVAASDLSARDANVVFPDLVVTRIALLLEKKSVGGAVLVAAIYAFAMMSVLYELTRGRRLDVTS